MQHSIFFKQCSLHQGRSACTLISGICVYFMCPENECKHSSAACVSTRGLVQAVSLVQKRQTFDDRAICRSFDDRQYRCSFCWTPKRAPHAMICISLSLSLYVYIYIYRYIYIYTYICMYVCMYVYIYIYIYVYVHNYFDILHDNMFNYTILYYMILPHIISHAPRAHPKLRPFLRGRCGRLSCGAAST